MSSYLASSRANLPLVSLTQAPQYTILCVEDEFVIRMNLANVLRDHGFKVIEAQDVYEALRKIRSEPIDLLLTEIWLGRSKAGLVLARCVFETFPDMLVAIVSTEAQPENGPKFWHVWFRKVFDYNRLVADLQNLLVYGHVSGTQPPARAASKGRRNQRRGMPIQRAWRRVHLARRRASRESTGLVSRAGQVRPHASAKRPAPEGASMTD